VPTENYRTYLESRDAIFRVWLLRLCSGPTPHNSPRLATPNYGLFTHFLAMTRNITGVSHHATFASMSLTSKRSADFQWLHFEIANQLVIFGM
jgi:hypothetical protein